MVIIRLTSIFPFITVHYYYSQINIIHRTPVFHGMPYERHCPGGFIVMVHDPTFIECDPPLTLNLFIKGNFRKVERCLQKAG